MDMSISEQQNRQNDDSEQEDEEEEDCYMTDREESLASDVDS